LRVLRQVLSFLWTYCSDSSTKNEESNIGFFAHATSQYYFRNWNALSYHSLLWFNQWVFWCRNSSITSPINWEVNIMGECSAYICAEIFLQFLIDAEKY